MQQSGIGSKTRINIDDKFMNGVYIVKVIIGDQLFTRKIIVAK